MAVIPTRGGNPAMEALERWGEFVPPNLAQLQSVLAWAIRLGRDLLFADLWDLARFSDCPDCLAARRARLEQMNLRQAVAPAVWCPTCRRTPAQ